MCTPHLNGCCVCCVHFHVIVEPLRSDPADQLHHQRQHQQFANRRLPIHVFHRELKFGFRKASITELHLVIFVPLSALPYRLFSSHSHSPLLSPWLFSKP